MKNRFVFIACYYNMHKFLPQMIHSICSQSYENWRLIITDDVSNDESTRDGLLIVDKFRQLVDDNNYGRSKIEFIINETKKWETLNVLTMIRNFCKPDDIVCRIDCDDHLIDSHALYAINQTYTNTNCEALWTAHRWFDENEITNMNISGPLSSPDPYRANWTMSHMKTFRASLLSDIKEENFYNQDGVYARRAGDRYLYLPVLHKAKKKMYLPMITYAYRCSLRPEVFQTDDAKFQKQEADYLTERGYIS
jgi:glycosyltransferase involved in cell wall biosynthesis